MPKHLRSAADHSDLVSAYVFARETVISSGYGCEVDWQNAVTIDGITETDFLREAAWVILSCGMRELVVRKRFAEVSSAFFHWKSSELIVSRRCECTTNALRWFNNSRKIDAIAQVAELLHLNGFERTIETIKEAGIGPIRELPYMGPATAFHFAKNIGLPVAKPDRHLLRIARRTGYGSPQVMCEEIARATGDTVPVVDLVIWRYATLVRDYLEVFPLAECIIQ